MLPLLAAKLSEACCVEMRERYHCKEPEIRVAELWVLPCQLVCIGFVAPVFDRHWAAPFSLNLGLSERSYLYMYAA